MVKIYLCDLANDFNGIDNKSIPLGVGFVATYCKKIHKDNVDIKVYRTYKKFIDSLDNLLDDWYMEGFEKDDVIEFMSKIIPSN